MKEKKNIDRLFQEKFKNFEAHPSNKVWKGIAAAQKQETDRKVIPLWWKLGGIAAALALLLGLSFVLSNTTDVVTETPTVVIENSDNDASRSNPSTKIQNTQNNDVVSTGSEELEPEDRFILNTNKKSLQTNLGASKNSENKNEDFLTVQNTKANPSYTRNSRVNSPLTDIKEDIAQNENLITVLKETTSTTTETLPISSNDKVLVASSDKITENSNTSVAQEEAPAFLNTENNLVTDAQKIKATQNEDATAIADADKKIDRWDVGAIAAPVYYSDFGGSSLDPQFKNNEKSGDVNLSYGVQVSYAISPKLKVRTGVNNVDLSYRTNDLAFSTNSFGEQSLKGIDYTRNGSAVTILDATVARANATTNNLIPGPQQNFTAGTVQQRLNYIEVPIEAVYTISDKRVGFSVVGGVSTLFLNTNEVLLLSDNLNGTLGSSSSVNDLSFTTNIGLGVDYKITEDFQFNLEPAFKYQINGYDESVGEFKPYFLGVYTGFSYKF